MPTFVRASKMRYNTLQLLTYASLSMSALVMPLYAAQVGASIRFIGWIGAAFGLASFLSSFVFGRLGDRSDRKRIMQTGFVISAIALLAQFFARTPETFLLARFAVGFALGIVPASLAAYVYEIRRPLGKFTSHNAMGWLFASILVVGLGSLARTDFQDASLRRLRHVLVDGVGVYEFTFLASAALCLLAGLFTVGVPAMRRALHVPLFPKEVIRNNLHVYVAVFLRHLGAAGIWMIYPLYIFELGGDLAMVGWVHVVNMVSQILVLQNVERFRTLASPPWLITLGLVFSGVTFWSFALVDQAEQLLPLQVLLGISFACLWLGSLKEVMEHNVERATATGMLNASLSLSNVAGPVLGGFVAAAYGFRATMFVAAGITAGALIVYLMMAPRRKPGARPAQSGGKALPGDVGP